MDFYSPQTAKYDGYFDIRQNDIIIVTWCLKTINFFANGFLNQTTSARLAVGWQTNF